MKLQYNTLLDSNIAEGFLKKSMSLRPAVSNYNCLLIFT